MSLAALTAGYLIGRPAPYGRHRRPGWGREIRHRVGWIGMELVSPVCLVSFYVGFGGGTRTTTMLVVLWCAHYLNRALIYPFRADWGKKRMPLVIAASAVLFNLVNGGLNGAALGSYRVSVGVWFWVGLVLFAGGAWLNIASDEKLLAIRREMSGYRIPEGGLFRWVSCPNYLGEIIEWSGFALMAWNPAVLSFAVLTAANLIPRALSHHHWYREHFSDYPARRRAILPGVL